MRAYDLFEEFKGLTQKQRDDVVGYFLAGPGMEFEGFRDSKDRPDYDKARYALDHFAAALAYAQGYQLRGRVALREWGSDVVELKEVEYQPGFVKIRIANEWPKEYDEPIRSGSYCYSVKTPIDWTPVLLLALIVFAFVMIWG